MASSGTGNSRPWRRARSMATAVPTALGRCEAIVEVCGGIHSGADPQTLCRPWAMGSSLAAMMDLMVSDTASISGACRLRAITNAPER